MLDGDTVVGIGITDQRETVVVWDRRTGRPRHRAIVWQDRRTAARCDELRAAGVEPLVRERTGLVLDPYFSATKLEWLLGEGGVVADEHLAFGTVDSWVLWNLTGEHATEPSNASRTMLYDLDARDWSDELLDLFGVPRSVSARGAAEQRPLRHHRSRRAPPASRCRCRASPATSRPRCSARRASRRA